MLPREKAIMPRTVLVLGLAAMAATILPIPALADDSVATTRLRPVTAAATPELPFTMGDVSCSLIPPAPVAHVGTGTCPGVRPGGRVVSTIGDCTLNFLFQAPDGTRYIGTAGHCVSPGPVANDEVNPDGKGRVERIWSWGSGPVAEDSDGHRIGEFAYAVIKPPKDFALIRLDPRVKASPEMCHFGAPRGVSTTDTDTAIVLQYYGNGIGIGNVAPARSAVALGTPNLDYIHALGLAAPGDSGAGVMTADGLAIGVLVTAGFHGIGFGPGPLRTPAPRRLPQADERGVDLGTMGITRLAPQLARASQTMAVPLELVTAR
jgi:hypothetical protein